MTNEIASTTTTTASLTTAEIASLCASRGQSAKRRGISRDRVQKAREDFLIGLARERGIPLPQFCTQANLRKAIGLRRNEYPWLKK